MGWLALLAANVLVTSLSTVVTDAGRSRDARVRRRSVASATSHSRVRALKQKRLGLSTSNSVHTHILRHDLGVN